MRVRRGLAILLLLPFLLAAAPEERGRSLYMEGTSPSGGEIVAVMGAGGEAVEVPASAMPCSSCHGRDGRGRPEGGVTPSDLTWDSLTRPYGVTHPSGRKHPPYDERSLKKAIAMGMDPAGNSLHVAMPRFRMSHQDMADLISYMKTLGHETDPGVTDTAIRIGTVLPPSGPLSSMSKAVREALAARFEEADSLWGRRIEIRTLELSGPPQGWPVQVKDFLGREEVFAVAGAFFAGADRELAGVFEELEVPVIGPFSLHPSENRYVFHLSPGLEDQMQALRRYAKTEGLENPVIFTGSGPAAVSLLREAEARGTRGNRPTLLATGAAADSALLAAPAAFDGRIFVAVPALPGETQAYRKLAADHALSRDQISAQLSALAAAEVLLEGLERSGRDLTRDRLIGSLEALRRFETGYGPPVTFGPAHRLGARGAYILKADLTRGTWIPAGGWIEAE